MLSSFLHREIHRVTCRSGSSIILYCSKLSVFSNMYLRWLVILSIAVAALCYYPSPAPLTHISSQSRAHTALLAHHVNKKITKRMMDRRPKKSRPSDIFRNNVNMDKCITKVSGSPDEYTMVSMQDVISDPQSTMKFWIHGDPEAEWLEITDEDKVLGLSPNVEPLAKEAIRKKPPLVRSGTW